MSIITKLKTVRDALNDVHDNVNHYSSAARSNEYIVWSEDGEGDSLHLDNSKNTQIITGTIDFYTTEEYSPVIDRIQKSLENHGITYALNSVQYEETTQFIHYEWRFEI